MQMIIFTDLDGSLLDHEDYSFEAARPSIERIKRLGIPLVMTTSKTRREVELLQREMGMSAPMIVENGGGIFCPPGYGNLAIDRGERQGEYTVIRVGTTYSAVRRFVEKAAAAFGIRGFGDMAPAEIAALTGLSLEKAALAKEREFTEPFLMEESEKLRPLAEAASAEGLKITRGGRFHHLIGVDQDKGVAVRIAGELFRMDSGEELVTIGLGDSANDLPMLEQVDIPVLIARPDGKHLDIELPGLIRAKAPGSRGWNDCVSRLLRECGEVQRKGDEEACGGIR
ncbi:MAG: HAD-IIB family hydrolase [Deltaproteobacteria bacterium]|nr:HAD-IIB family hydrolase [Deltaproteobacteria bacterium]